ncbi:BBE domain-containing protein [Catenuloplanes japonicus]|uniref:BBE domain-containing protein n=1 Tax=Catenuloplanes japonicus TaxID=33876 RepID=UPI0012F79722|nr:BBE domain-containing protein [Catenuloplanes japonicus]
MVNFISPDEGLTATALRAIYGAALYDRIADVKQKYDPSNMFRHNHTIVAL